MRWIVAALLVVGLQVQQPAFRTVTELVPIWVRIEDARGEPVDDLRLGDLNVTLGGAPVGVETLARGNPALAVAMMVQTGYESHGHARRPTQSLVDALFDAVANHLQPGDRVRIGSYGVEVVVGPLDTDDGPLLKQTASEEIWMRRGWNALWRGVLNGLDAIPTTPGRRVLMVVGDGLATADGLPDGSTTMRGRARDGGTEASALERAISAHATVVGISLSSRRPDRPIVRLAEQTGGSATLIESDVVAEEAIAGLFTTLRDYWLLGIRVPEAPHDLQAVQVTSRRSEVRVVSQRRAIYRGRP